MLGLRRPWPGGSHGPRRALAALAVVLAGALHLVVGFFAVAAVGLVGAPVWAWIVLATVWTGGAALLVRAARGVPAGSRTPLASPLVPVVCGLLLWALVTAGQAWLGWSP